MHSLRYGERMVKSVPTRGKDLETQDIIYYRYDAIEKRTRNVIERQTNVEKAKILKETFYVGGAFEMFRKYAEADMFQLRYTSSELSNPGDSCFSSRSILKERTVGLLNRYCSIISVTFRALQPSRGTRTPTFLPAKSMRRTARHQRALSFGKQKYPTDVDFLGKDSNKTGPYHLDLRYYASWLGRFHFADPKGSVDG
ncbi:hypothetical protein IF1G_02365 [Cordyceps javanica]|uniref:Uncharacterized protein n=1 Tax=Cordyceps javanica TaxID=43265 RepID=A0A545V990_9HYPO|nr:hypothetical protein IF1G_02365 [Cordyceps javanica]